MCPAGLQFDLCAVLGYGLCLHWGVNKNIIHQVDQEPRVMTTGGADENARVWEVKYNRHIV